MRIATYNIEWFTNLFDRTGRMLSDGEWSSRYKVTREEQLGAIGIVLTALNADAIMIIEAPDNNRRRQTVSMLEGFANAFDLRQRRALIGFSNDTQQEIALLYDPDVVEAVHDPRGGDGESPRFDQSYRIDLDIDATLDTVTFSKPPLEVALRTRAGRLLHLIGVHIKSKAPHGAGTPEAATRIAIENRRKQMAQCIWLRERVEEHLARKDSVIVLGDFNDGPGLDEYEKLFGRSGLDIVVGEQAPPERRLRDPHTRIRRTQGSEAAPASARFYLPQEGHFFSAMLDFILQSPDLCVSQPKWRIWHPFDDPVCYKTPELREALLQASDHFPVSVDISL
jgi:hypothetical protein